MSGLQVIRSFSMCDVGSAQSFGSLIAFNEAYALIVSVTLFLFFQLIAMVEWETPDWQAITITDFLPS